MARSLFREKEIFAAVKRLGYVQADPIRAPARAQDLILRLRVADYRADDLENQYPALPLIEDAFYNYGFFAREALTWLLPRERSLRWVEFMASHTALRRRVLRMLREHAEVHPRDAAALCGDGARVNGWGGTSNATTLMLEGLHREGKVIVARRDRGIKVYAAAPAIENRPSAYDRADALVRLIVNLYAPIPERSLLTFLRGMQRYRPQLDFVGRFEQLVKTTQLQRAKIENLVYVWPADEEMEQEVRDEAHILAPFDPIVWDRPRFEELWGWEYKFEAYTPAQKRLRGYYAMPVLWRDDVVGWVNVTTGVTSKKPKLDFDLGLVRPLPRGEKSRFKAAWAEEQKRFATFLTPRAE